MTKIIGLKELQQKTKQIREEVAKGVHFIVIYRSKPVFEIKPLDEVSFAAPLRASGLYKEEFLKRMEEAENDIKSGRVSNFKSTEEFLKSLES